MCACFAVGVFKSGCNDSDDFKPCMTLYTVQCILICSEIVVVKNNMD